MSALRRVRFALDFDTALSAAAKKHPARPRAALSRRVLLSACLMNSYCKTPSSARVDCRPTQSDPGFNASRPEKTQRHRHRGHMRHLRLARNSLAPKASVMPAVIILLQRHARAASVVTLRHQTVTRIVIIKCFAAAQIRRPVTMSTMLSFKGEERTRCRFSSAQPSSLA